MPWKLLQTSTINLIRRSSLAETNAAVGTDCDPYLWLEETESLAALAWVEERNRRVFLRLQALPRFDHYREQIAKRLDSNNRPAVPNGSLPSGSEDGRIYNFWRDVVHPRGTWRVATQSSFDAGHPDWRPLLDVDACARAEARDFVWRGAILCGGESERCLVALSDGGSDAVELREFDIARAEFISDGFFSPVSKQSAVWQDEDCILIAREFGTNTVTLSGYARQVRRWRRGAALTESEVLLEIPADQVGAGPKSFEIGRAHV